MVGRRASVAAAMMVVVMVRCDDHSALELLSRHHEHGLSY
jgi:hypothetical protein